MNGVDTWLETSFSLTPAERQLALALVNGENLKSFALTRKVSIHTARAQLGSIFVKTGVNRQANLILLIMAGSRRGARAPSARFPAVSTSLATHP